MRHTRHFCENPNCDTAYCKGCGDVVLTPAQCELIASALEVINPDDAEIEKQARALAIQFRAESLGL